MTTTGRGSDGAHVTRRAIFSLRACVLVLALGAVLLIPGCLSDSGNQEAGEDVLRSDGDYTPAIPVLPEGWPALHWPADNPYSPAKAILGRRLFFESALSRDATISCAWCHAPGNGFADKHRTALSTGVGGALTTRNSPTIANMAFATSFMYDGAASTLEEQVLLPLLAPHEMDMTSAEIEARLSVDSLYVRLFRHAYGSAPITLENAARALATYQRTLVSSRAPYDRWAAGDSGALSESAKRGAVLFMGERGGCARCHAPPLFTDGKFHDIGLDSVLADSGRALVTGFTADAGKFKTPTLRNVQHTGPYMHDGRVAGLDQVVIHYNSESIDRPRADSLLRPLGLTEAEASDLVSFLEALTDDSFLHSPQP